uniref:Ferric reductase NAD binding domain-containing protein n=1 Tax=Rhodosorus marinus TaxID=101924 RepID=A0A7S2ZFK6_9RHOD
MACYPELYATCQYLEKNNNFEIKLHLTREESGPSEQIDMETMETSSPQHVRSSPSEVSADGSGENVKTYAQEDTGVDSSENTSSENTSSEGDLKHGEKLRSRSALVGYGAAIAMVVAVFGIGLFSFFWPRAAFQTGLDREELDCYHWNQNDIPSLSAYQMFMCFYVQAVTMTISILMAAIAGGVVVLLYPLIVERKNGWKNFNPPKQLARGKVTTPWVVGRPEFDKVIGTFAESDAESVGVMVAGPERMVLELEKLCLKQNKLEFFRESWKV